MLDINIEIVAKAERYKSSSYTDTIRKRKRKPKIKKEDTEWP
jgi:hypothetical protein